MMIESKVTKSMLRVDAFAYAAKSTSSNLVEDSKSL
jgi:hypothetical protein